MASRDIIAEYPLIGDESMDDVGNQNSDVEHTAVAANSARWGSPSFRARAAATVALVLGVVAVAALVSLPVQLLVNRETQILGASSSSPNAAEPSDATSLGSYLFDSYLTSITGNAVDEMTGAEQCDRAALLGLNTGMPWTTPDAKKQMAVKMGEGGTLAAALRSRDLSGLKRDGIFLEGNRYDFDKTMTGYKGIINGAVGKRRNGEHVTIQRSRHGIVIGHSCASCDVGITSRAVTNIVGALESHAM